MFLIIASTFLTAVLTFRLFNLSVLQHSYYLALASNSQEGYVELPAQRGEIYIKDYHSDENFLLATNITLNLLYADPTLIKDPDYVAKKLTPLLFNLKDARRADTDRVNETAHKLAPELSKEEIDQLLRPLGDNELKDKFIKDLTEKIGSKIRPQITLATNLTTEKIGKINDAKLAGIETVNTNVYAYPRQISNLAFTAEKLAPLVEIPSKKLQQILVGENRYVVLQEKLDPDISDKIKKIIVKDKEMMRGIGMHEEYFRYYPEENLAANLVGYVSNNVGQYGIESSMNTQLQGIAGKFETKKDSIGRQITVGDSVIQPAVDGSAVVLTIDRSIQAEAEKLLKEGVEKYQADDGQIIVMDPKTGAVIAMANYPTFNPNKFGDAFNKTELNLNPEEIKNLVPSKNEGVYYVYTNPVTLDKYEVFSEKDREGNNHYYRYENFIGPEVYHNKIVSWPYEPGSVFKSIVMAIAIDDKDVTPNTTYNDSGPVGVDWNKYSKKYDYEIKNVLGYFGLINMTTVIAKSLNTGMTFVAKKIGPSLFYSYLKKFGLLDRTDIELDNEVAGKVEYFENWTESELATHAFGQGLTVNMLQLANAYNVIANGGILMQPYIIEKITQENERSTETEPREIRRVISEETSNQMIAMLINSVENGEARQGKVEGHYVGGKTGTSQTYKYGQALSGKGTTIASFAGFGPVKDPQFVIVVKYYHPKTSEWGSSTAAPTFSKLAQFIFDYYNIPPDKK